MSGRALLVIGSGLTGSAVIEDALQRGLPVVLLDERASQTDLAAFAARGVTVHAAATDIGTLLDEVDVVSPSPGVPSSHPVLRAAADRGIPVRSEVDLALERLAVPVVAVTGTNGKTTVTSLIDEVLRAGGLATIAAGNIGQPMITCIGEPFDVIVAELSSFQLHFTNAPAFRVAVWLNIADDHYDWHPDLAHYAAAKARIMEGQTPNDLFVFNADDPIVAEYAQHAPGRRVGFSLHGDAGTYTVRGEELIAPDGTTLIAISDLPSRAPHDVANVLAAAAVARELGVEDAAIARVVATFAKLPHRVELICEAGGVRFVDDSKATNPHAAVAAIRSFDHVVLIAGGRNKGLDLGALRVAAAHLRAVVAIGDAAEEVVRALGDLAPTKTATSMADAVRIAAAFAEPGDAVLLSPACASFDWYANYGERGEDFARTARAMCAGQSA